MVPSGEYYVIVAKSVFKLNFNRYYFILYYIMIDIDVVNANLENLSLPLLH